MKFIYFNCGTGVSLFPTELSSQLGAAHLWLRNIPADIDGKDMKWIYEFHLFELRITFYANDRSSQLCTQLKKLRKKAWKKFRLQRGSNPWPLRYRTRGWRGYEVNIWNTGIAEVTGSNPVQAWIFSGFFPQLLKLITLLRLSIICLKS